MSQSLRMSSRSEQTQATHEQPLVEISSSPISLQKIPEQPTVVPPVQYSTLPISHSEHETVEISSQTSDILSGETTNVFEKTSSSIISRQKTPEHVISSQTKDVLFEEAFTDNLDDTLDFDEPSFPTQMVGTLLLQSS